ncbi:uncharacterized protein VP01_66g5 [Puccinia sorghi]|uniref:Endoplasmic reticulum-Golgi intermediate compartment protein 3 n=1 Tax=Puccinia sorghi TaxID=27349 RepID=A0A0L6UES8_9BASI|nr:uncharacterized protein VP01_66g5 [Puccinia sorghi]
MVDFGWQLGWSMLHVNCRQLSKFCFAGTPYTNGDGTVKQSVCVAAVGGLVAAPSQGTVNSKLRQSPFTFPSSSIVNLPAKSNKCSRIHNQAHLLRIERLELSPPSTWLVMVSLEVTSRGSMVSQRYVSNFVLSCYSWGRLRADISSFFCLPSFISQTMEDVKVKTGFGGMLTMASAVLIFTLILVEFRDYRQIHVQPSILVDKSRGEKLLVHMNITFPRVPCYLLSVDVMDISGEHQNGERRANVAHDMTKTRLDSDGVPLSVNATQKLQGELESIIASRAKDCSLIAALAMVVNLGPQDVVTAAKKFEKPTFGGVGVSIILMGSNRTLRELTLLFLFAQQCVQEHWSERIKEQSKEGCNVNGVLKVNKVIGNLHLSPGRSFQTHQVHVHDLVPYLQDSNLHDFGHVIHNFAFMDANQPKETAHTMRLKRKLGIVNPLDGVKAHTEASNYMFQYFLKVVGTQFQLLDGQVAKTHQYSVTQYERDLEDSEKSDADELGHLTTHGRSGVPGVFFNYEISPMQVVHQEYRQSFAHFATSTCAIVGGVLTIAGLLDSFVYGAQNRMKGGSTNHGASHSRTGKVANLSPVSLVNLLLVKASTLPSCF